MERLRSANLVETIRSLRQPLLGVCVGMQLLFESSEEGDVPCLGLLPGRVRRFADRDGLPVPHMGWNQLEFSRPSPLLDDVASGDYVYFVHSYCAPRQCGHRRRDDLRRAVRRDRSSRQRVRCAVSPGAFRASRRARPAQLPARVMKGFATMELIPAIDLRDGRCVRLLKGDFAAETVYSDDPQERSRELSGARRASRPHRRSRRRARRHAAESPDRAAAGEEQQREAAGGRRSAHDRAHSRAVRRRRRSRSDRQHRGRPTRIA